MVDQITEQEKSSGSRWNHARFIGKVIWATKNHPIALSDFPKKIDLTGKVGEISDELLAKTLADPQKRERGKLAKVDLDGKLRIAKEESIGEGTHVKTRISMHIERDLLNPQYSEREYLALDIHTHGSIDVPPSPQDLSHLLRPTEEGGVQGIIVITPSSRFLIIKTLDTPDLSTEEVEKFIKESKTHLRDYYEHMRIFSLTEDLYVKSTVQENMRFVIDTCRKYRLKLYTSRGDNVYTEAS